MNSEQRHLIVGGAIFFLSASFLSAETLFINGAFGRVLVNGVPYTAPMDFPTNDVVTVEAQALPGGAFQGWEGDLSGTSLSQSLTMNSDKMATAIFSDGSDLANFNIWCLGNLGAEKESLVYDTFGQILAFQADGEWVHESENSAVLAIQTNLPAFTYVQYGETIDYGSWVGSEERPYYLHIHHVRGLAPGQTYHYRFVAFDERGNQITSSPRTFTTRAAGSAVTIPGAMSGPPYDLTQAGATYIVTEDIVADGTAISINVPNVTLDLNGHTVTYNNSSASEAYGVYVHYGGAGMKIVNGMFRQGAGNGGPGDFIPVRARQEGEVAGVIADYSGNQVTGLYAYGDIHHNIIQDQGVLVENRHSGCDGIYGTRQAHHNLIKRVRQRGIFGERDGQYNENEIYLDSCATNSFGVFLYTDSNITVDHNRIFGTGYHALGVGTIGQGVGDIIIEHNFIHLKTLPEPDSRWAEYGEQSGVNGLRVTWGGNNIEWRHNVIVVDAFGTGPGEVRGIWHVPQRDQTDLVYHDNIIKAIDHGTKPRALGAVVICGGSDPYVYRCLFRNNRVMSNFCNLSLGGAYYGSGSNGLFVENTFVRLGSEDRYRTVMLRSYQTPSLGHVIVDSAFENGASLDSVAVDPNWAGGGGSFSAGHSLYVVCEDTMGVRLGDRFIVVEDSVGIPMILTTDGDGAARLYILENMKQAEGGSTSVVDVPHTDHMARVGGHFPVSFPVDHINTPATPYTLVFTRDPTPNLPPEVNAGADMDISLPQRTLALNGSVTDDGRPNPPSRVITTWSQVSGPGTVDFYDVYSSVTTAIFPEAGTYVLRLTGNDWEHVASDEVTVNVSAQAGNVLWDACERLGDYRWKNSGVTRSVRLLIDSAHIVSSAGSIVLEFQGRLDESDTQIKGVSIAEADLASGQGHIVDETWTPVTFDGGSVGTWGTDVITVPAGSVKLSDEIDFAVDSGKNYYVTFMIQTPSVYLNVPTDFVELAYAGDRTAQRDWGDADTYSDYHAFARLYGVRAPSGDLPTPPPDSLGKCINIIKAGVSNEAVFNFHVSVSKTVVITLVNRQGVVRELVNRTFEPGQHLVSWAGENDEGNQVASGIYMAVVKIGDKKFTKKIAVVR